MFILVTLLFLAMYTRNTQKRSHNKAKVLEIFFVEFSISGSFIVCC